ncbi:MAG: antibiotic biosynthesis monooxygenase [Deltaproteobacteria bacterium]|nr:antibiotic biosynthesis monooxygenase [Deltaproteobacteria bacterium]MBW2448426.1 antibiotic biosynthesis monooxygenase [Deltaproteobacteria bacterium]
MVTIGMNYNVLPGKEEVFEAAFSSVLDAIEAADGHDHSRLYKGVGGGPNADYLIVSRWGSEQAFKDFTASAAFKKVTNWGAENILAGRPSHTTYQED